MGGDECVMTRKLLSGVILILVIIFLIFVFTSDRGISGLMEDFGKFIARFFE